MAEEARWYVVHTYSGYENKVLDSIKNVVENRGLHSLIVDFKVPTEMVEEIKDQQTKVVERKLFPSYVFVKMIMTDDTWYIVRNIRGVTGFVGPGSKPVPLTEEEISRFEVESRKVEVQYNVGDSVMINEDSMNGFVGIVESINLEAGTVCVKVSMMGQEVAVEVDLKKVEPLK